MKLIFARGSTRPYEGMNQLMIFLGAEFKNALKDHLNDFLEFFLYFIFVTFLEKNNTVHTQLIFSVLFFFFFFPNPPLIDSLYRLHHGIRFRCLLRGDLHLSQR